MEDGFVVVLPHEAFQRAEGADGDQLQVGDRPRVQDEARRRAHEVLFRFPFRAL
jgi:hypothetical protein